MNVVAPLIIAQIFCAQRSMDLDSFIACESVYKRCVVKRTHDECLDRMDRFMKCAEFLKKNGIFK